MLPALKLVGPLLRVGVVAVIALVLFANLGVYTLHDIFVLV